MNLPESENQYVEFKQSFNATVIEMLVAFANSKGGTVYVGVEDNGKVNEIKFKTIPALIPDVEVVESAGHFVLLLSVQEYPVKPVSTQGRYYKRVGNSNHKLSIAEVVDDDPLTFLMKYDLIRDGKLSNVAYLLFKKNDSILTTIELGYFQNDIVIKDSDRSKEDILTQMDRVMDFVRKHINKEVIITGNSQSIHRWQYPLEAIREIVMNMIIHRDYRSTSDSIVKIYPDRIEFYNPGRLPENITVEDLLANTYKSTPRNKQIADFCKDLGIIEKYGSRIRRILDCFREEKLQLPAFGNISDGFMVTVFGDRVGGTIGKWLLGQSSVLLEGVKERIIQVMIESPSVTVRQLSSMLDMNKSAVQRHIDALKKKNILGGKELLVENGL